MSKNEGKEEEQLSVMTAFFIEKAHSSLRVTVVREGMSVGEDRVIGSTLQIDGMRKTECPTVTPFSSECSEYRQVYSSLHSIITTSHDQFS